MGKKEKKRSIFAVTLATPSNMPILVVVILSYSISGGISILFYPSKPGLPYSQNMNCTVSDKQKRNKVLLGMVNW